MTRSSRKPTSSSRMSASSADGAVLITDCADFMSVPCFAYCRLPVRSGPDYGDMSGRFGVGVTPLTRPPRTARSHSRKRYKVAFALCLALAACGSSSPKPTAQGARAVIGMFASDLEGSRYADACQLMTSAGRAQVGGGDQGQCAGRLALAGAIGANQLEAAIKRTETAPMTLRGSRASVSNGNGGTTTLVYQGGHWLIGP